MTEDSKEFTRTFFKRIVGNDRKCKTFGDRMYVSLGDNKVAFIELGLSDSRKNYGWDSITVHVFDKNHGRIDSISINFESACKGTEFEENSRKYFINCNGTNWYLTPPEEVINLIHNELESYLEIFEEGF